MKDLGMDELPPEEQQLARVNIGANSRLGHVYKPVWERYLSRFTVDEVQALLNKHGGNAYRHNDYPHLFAHPQTQHLDFLRQVAAPTGDGTVTVMAPPWQFSDADIAVRLPPPALGQHTAEVLAELGITV
jgi:crotonobetainyl-CoA:carnitine CoA-transferase CaiB-like acyl-CoA transferase